MQDRGNSWLVQERSRYLNNILSVYRLLPYLRLIICVSNFGDEGRKAICVGFEKKIDKMVCHGR